jgi:hypothetical protein
MARGVKDNEQSQDALSHRIIDTRVLQSQSDVNVLHQKTSNFQEQCLRAALAKLGGFRFVGGFTTVDVTGYTPENPANCEVLFTYTFVGRPSSKKSAEHLNPDRTIFGG